MSSESPAAILFSTDGYELAVQGGVATPAGTRALLTAGSDGSITRIMLMDGYSRQVFVGAGTAGGPTGGILSIQGVTSGTAVTVAQATASNLNAAVVGTGTAGTPVGGVLTVQGATGGYALPVSATPIKSSSSSTTTVASSASNVMLLTTNTNRLGASVFNDSNSIVYIKLGATASLTSFAIKLYPNSYWEVPSNYVGQIDAIWANANGNARITELT
jgi:hypothetical protein